LRRSSQLKSSSCTFSSISPSPIVRIAFAFTCARNSGSPPQQVVQPGTPTGRALRWARWSRLCVRTRQPRTLVRPAIPISVGPGLDSTEGNACTAIDRQQRRPGGATLTPMDESSSGKANSSLPPIVGTSRPSVNSFVKIGFLWAAITATYIRAARRNWWHRPHLTAVL